MKKRECQYIEGLDDIDKEKIQSMNVPWQRFFLTRFYKRLQEQNLSKKEICDAANSNPNPLITAGYQLNKSTLSQYTNLKKEQLNLPSVDALLSISTVLNVSMDYLLGIELSEQHDITDVHQATGLSSNAIATLKSNREAQLFIDVLLQSDLLTPLLQQIEQLFITDYVSNDIMSAYSNSLTKIIIDSFKEYMKNVSPLDYSSKKYQDYLIQHFHTLDITVDENYIITNVSSDRLNQIRLLSEYYHQDLSSSFYDDTITCVYEILNFRISGSNYFRSQLSNTFLDFIDIYLAHKKNNLTTHLKNHES